MKLSFAPSFTHRYPHLVFGFLKNKINKKRLIKRLNYPCVSLTLIYPHLFFLIGASHLQTLRDTERVWRRRAYARRRQWRRAYARRHQRWSYARPSALVGGARRHGVATGGVATGRLITE
jgi:hypothetical protein